MCLFNKFFFTLFQEFESFGMVSASLRSQCRQSFEIGCVDYVEILTVTREMILQDVNTTKSLPMVRSLVKLGESVASKLALCCQETCQSIMSLNAPSHGSQRLIQIEIAMLSNQICFKNVCQYGWQLNILSGKTPKQFHAGGVVVHRLPARGLR